MPRRLIFSLLLAALPAMPQLLPEKIGEFHLASKASVPTPDQAVWTELGLEDSGQGTYEGPAGRYTLTLYRVQDSTASLAAFDWLRPPDARPAKVAPLAAETATGMIVGTGNYLLLWNGHKPSPEELNAILLTVPRYQHSGLPTLPGFFPTSGIHPNSERYIVGPASLAKFFPEVPPSVAAFRLNGEGETAVFGKDGGVRLALFSYPTFEIARKQAVEFAKIPGAVTKRSGPLVAVIVKPSNADEAEKVLSQVRYQIEVTSPEKPPTKRDNPVNLLWNIALLIGILIVFCTISGLAFGFLRQFLRRFVAVGDEESMVTLKLSDRWRM
jgi:hypothetical protein